MDETPTVPEIWDPTAVRITIESAVKNIAGAAIAYVVVKNAANFVSITGRDVIFNVLQRKWYKL